MLTPEQIVIVGLVASLLTQVFKFAADKLGFSPSAEVKIAVLFAISVGLAAIFGLPQLPPIGEPFEFAKALLEAAVSVLGVAALAYKLLLEKVVFPAFRLGSVAVPLGERNNLLSS